MYGELLWPDLDLEASLTSPCWGGGVFEHPPPLRFFADNKNGGAQRRRIPPTLSPIFLATFVKVLILGHARSGHQVRLSDHILQNFTIAPQLQCLRKGMKLSEYDKVVGTYKMYILDFWYLWP